MAINANRFHYVRAAIGDSEAEQKSAEHIIAQMF